MTTDPDQMEFAPLPELIQLPERPRRFLVDVDRFLEVGATRDQFEVSGKGLAVAVIDTGLRADHLDFAGKVLAQRNFTTANGRDPDDAADEDGHGTHVGGIIVAGGAVHKGIAPGAGIVPIKVLPGPFSLIGDALQWLIDNQAALHITAVNISMSDGGNHLDDFRYARHRYRKLIKTLRGRRVPVVVAAGNHYFSHGSRQGMAFPAILRECVSVGAVYDEDIGPKSYLSGAEARSTRAGQITPFSQRLHSSVSRLAYTDIFAPGSKITSSGIRTEEGFSIDSEGTSQAAPVTTGIILLMQEYHLRHTGELPRVIDLVRWLRRGGVKIHDGDDENDNVAHTGRDFIRVHAPTALEAMRRELIKKRIIPAG